MIALGVACEGGKGKPVDENKGSPAIKIAPTPEREQPAVVAPVSGDAVEVTALQLVKDYKDDDISADDKYRNRQLRVTGKLSVVGRDVFDMEDPTVVRFVTAAGEVQARFVGAAPKSLKAGQLVVLLCTGAGYQMVMALLGGCAVEQTAPD